MALTAYYTLSRGGAIEIAVALIVLLALHPRRLEVLPTLALGSAGAALAIAAATQRHALADNLQNAAAARQGDEMLAVVLIVCAGVALLRVALGLAIRHGLWPRPTLSREVAALLVGGLATVALAVGLASGLPDRLSTRLARLQAPAGRGGAGAFHQRLRVGSLSAVGVRPRRLLQRSPDRHRSGHLRVLVGPPWNAADFVRNAHNLYLETLAELGIPGLTLLLALLGSVFVIGLGKWRRAESYERALLAAALAAAAAFVTAAAIDWVWQLTVIPVAFLLLAAAVLRTSAGTRQRSGEPAARDRQAQNRARWVSPWSRWW